MNPTSWTSKKKDCFLSVVVAFVHSLVCVCDSEEDLLVKPQKEWVHMDKLEPEKLEWMRDLPAPRRKGTRKVGVWGGLPFSFNSTQSLSGSLAGEKSFPEWTHIVYLSQQSVLVLCALTGDAGSLWLCWELDSTHWGSSHPPGSAPSWRGTRGQSSQNTAFIF